MHILLTGGTGFIGQALVPALRDENHEVSVLSRSRHEEGTGLRYVTALDALPAPVDAVINLAGASLAAKRWNASYKTAIRNSRLRTTSALGRYFAKRDEVPGVWLNGSAIGFYGPQDDRVLDESAANGQGFAAALCRDWEQAAQDSAPSGTRLCLLRLGVVLDADGGAFAQMAAPFRMGIGNWVASGQQFLSWIHRRDTVAAIQHLLKHDTASGAFNLTAPNPVTSREFCAAMKRQYRTLVMLPMPAPMMRLMVGEMADELLITGQRVLPKALEQSGFRFSLPDIDTAIANITA
ncbi:MAG: TIGR01777 family oxidoreductase [Pseudomonadota bacterium]